jgi:protein-S-isoprenylcysteine O-methyltransferase Ste14
MEERPEKKRLWMASFATQATRGLIRDQKTRRIVMGAALVGALLLIVAGSTFLREALDPKERTLAFVLFWIACGWLTILAILLALFDLLIVRAQSRAARKTLAEQIVTSAGEGEANARKQKPR